MGKLATLQAEANRINASIADLERVHRDTARGMFHGRKRSVQAVASAIGESEDTARDVLASIGAEFSHTGNRTGKSYYKLPGGGPRPVAAPANMGDNDDPDFDG